MLEKQSESKNIQEALMTSKDVVDFYSEIDSLGIKIWIDGGWSVDALLGRQLRTHKDIDIAIQWRDVPKLREILTTKGYRQVREDNQWNFVLRDDNAHEIDVHAFIYDDKGNIIDGIMYPAKSLTGTGIINGQTVRCISPEYMVKFLVPWVYKWSDKYLPAISALCDKFGIELPKEYLELRKSKN